MLFDSILVGIIFLFSLSTPVAVCLAFKKGYALGVKDYNISHDIKKNEPKHVQKKMAKDNADIRRMRVLLDNIDNYDGTSAHQQELN